MGSVIESLSEILNPFGQNDVPNLDGRTALVTGGTHGIGLEVAKSLAKANARVLVLSRKQESGDEAIKKIQNEAAGGADIEFISIDLGNLKNVREVADRIREGESRLDILVADAGVGVNAYGLSDDGIERHFSINNLGHILLINRLLPLIRQTAKLNQSPAPRIIQLSSSLHIATPYSTTFSSLEEINDDSLGPNSLYGRSKLGNILFTRWLSAHILEDDSRIYALATHPGAVHTEQQDQFKEAYGVALGTALKTITTPFMRSPEQGSLSTLWAATSSEIEEKKLQGIYITDPGNWGGESRQAQDETLRENFWKLSDSLLKEKAGRDALLDWSLTKRASC